MTTVTIESPTPVSVLDHKKRFAQALDARDAARTAYDKIKSAPRAAREGLMSLFRRLHLDSVLGSFTDTVARWATVVWDKALWVRDYVSRILGWRMLGAYALTDTEMRNRLGDTAGKGYLIASGAVGKIAGWAGKVPFVGGLLQSAILTPLRWMDRAVYRSAGFVKKYADAYTGHWTVSAIHKLAEFGLFGRLVRAFVPSRYRFALYLAYWFKPAKNAYDRVSEDEVGEKIGKQVGKVRDSARAASAEIGDIVVDRVMDGPSGKPVITQPGTEIMDATVVETGERIQLLVDIDSGGRKWTTWKGTTYAIDELPDDIAPLPVDLVTESARLEQARRAANANSDTPPIEESRAVARALGATGPRKQQVHAKPGGKPGRR